MPVPGVMIPDWEAQQALEDKGIRRMAGEEPMREVKLGAILGVKTVRNVPKFRSFYTESASYTPPASVDYGPQARASLNRMYANDRLGICVFSGKGHAEGVQTGNDDTNGPQEPVLATDQELVDQYFAVCGPGDNGCYIDKVLNYYKTTGITMAGVRRKIDGWCEVDWTDKELVKAAIDLFGGVTIGFDVPQSWANNARPGFLWDTTSSRTVGGHDVFIYGYNETGVLVSTWGVTGTMTWAAFLSRRWIGECYVHFGTGWYGKDKIAGGNMQLNVEGLKAAFAQIEAGVDPTPTPAPPVPPEPPLPPVPPTPPPVERMAITLTGSFPTMFGHETVTITGHGVPSTTAAFGIGLMDWVAIVRGVLAIVSAVQAQDWPAAIAAVEKLLRDLGIIESMRANSRDFPVWIIPLIVRYGPVIIRIVVEGRAAGKSWQEILREILAAIGGL